MKSRLAPSLLCALAVVGMATLTGSRAMAAPQQDDGYIQREVLHELRMLPNYSVFDDVKFAVQGGEVALSGEVVNSALKDEAAAAAKGVKGVTNVKNDIKILPLSGGDQEIRRALYRSIYGEAQLSKYAWQSVQSIHIIVENGHVKLEGVVDNESDKNIAYLRARAVPGTFSVDNNLQVANQGPR
jgi:hyperosmotically inducible periplasmic protein